MVKIYTKTGDTGETSLFGGTRISKGDARVEAYGNLDELTSFIGYLIAHVTDHHEAQFLTGIQKDLYSIMANVAGSKNPIEKINIKIKKLEQYIDSVDLKLPKLTRFILPQGGEIATLFHITRTVCRRAERSLVRVPAHTMILQYVNRLSDLMFVLARLHTEGPEMST